MSRKVSLDHVRIARPCPARWEDMAGDDRVRFCGLCRKNVYNLSALSRDDATRLVSEHEGELCGLLYRRPDGTVLTSDCPVGVRAFAARATRRIAAAVAGLLLAVGGRYFTPALEGKRYREAASEPQTPALDGLHPRVSPEDLKVLGSLGYVASADDPNAGADRGTDRR